MTDSSLWCECNMPFVWHPAPLQSNAAALEREALLQLVAINQMESSHDIESSGTDHRRMERLEAKLDLTLYLLARTLEPGPMPESCLVRLSSSGIAWFDHTPPAQGSRVLLEMHPSVTLPLSLKLIGMIVPGEEGWVRAQFTGVGEAVFEALHQFIFRRHRQAIRSRQN
jgi:hypothetical protein